MKRALLLLALLCMVALLAENLCLRASAAPSDPVLIPEDSVSAQILEGIPAFPEPMDAPGMI